MSQIKKALEKAKKDRELFSFRGMEQAPGESSPQDIQAPARTLLVERETQSQTSNDITSPVYSQTRVVQVDRQRLITERVFFDTRKGPAWLINTNS